MDYKLNKLIGAYPNARKNTMSGMKKYGLDDLVGIESYILTDSGTVLIQDGKKDIVVQSYPKLYAPEFEGDLPVLGEEYDVELKVEGHNCRIVYLGSIGNFVAILRGGFICAQTTTILRERFGEKFMRFFLDGNEDVVLCGEVVGRGSIANVNVGFLEEEFGFGEVGFFLFDAFYTGHDGLWLHRSELDSLSGMYGIKQVPYLGEYSDVGLLMRDMEKIDVHYEGVVLKSVVDRSRQNIFKLKWKYFCGKFDHKLVHGNDTGFGGLGGARVVPPEQIILDHFMQGYAQEELGLRAGMSPLIMRSYEIRVGKLEEVARRDRGKIRGEVLEFVDWMMGWIETCGEFDDEMLGKIRKVFQRRLGGIVGRSVRRSAGGSVRR